MIGIICATDDEFAAILALDAARSPRPPRVIAGEAFHTVAFGDAGLAVVTRTQIGKVNAAIAATLMLSHLDLKAAALIVVGVGGALDPGLLPGETIIALEVGCHDYGMVDPSGMKPVRPGDFPPTAPRAMLEPVHATARQIALDLLATPRVRALADTPGQRLRGGGVLSGDLFINSDSARDALHRDFGADIVDMESHAVLQVGQRFDAPVVILRSASDSAGDGADGQYTASLAQNCDRAAGFLADLLELISSGRYPGFSVQHRTEPS